MADARFEDSIYSDQPLRLEIRSPEDLDVASTLLQDAVGRNGEISWMPRRHRLAIMVNRFRWEDRTRAASEGRAYERVRSVLLIDGAVSVQARGLIAAERDAIYSMLAIRWTPGEDAAGRLTLTLARAAAQGGEIAADVECLDARLIDLTRPWEARSAQVPGHED